MSDKLKKSAQPRTLPDEAPSPIQPLTTLNLQVPELPGIDPETVKVAGLRAVTEAEALRLTGLSESGLLIPYSDLDGNPLLDSGNSYFRLRLDCPKGDQKYHQRAGSSAHVYIPHHFRDASDVDEIFIIEGEKKALALCDSGRYAVGISGFYGYVQTVEGKRELVPELDIIRINNGPKIIYFAGDQDTLFNAQFYDAAIKCQKYFPGAKVRCCQVPLSAPGKGFDDCRAAMTDLEFKGLINEVLTSSQALEIGNKSTVGRLALKSMRQQENAIKEMAKDESTREEMVPSFVKLSAGLELFKCTLERDVVRDMAVNLLGVTIRTYNQLVKDRVKLQRSSTAETFPDDPSVPQIVIGAQQGVWAADAAKVLGERLYWHGGRFTDIREGELHVYDPVTLATYLDLPSVCQFFLLKNDGAKVSVRVSENDLKYVAGVPNHNPHLVRQIKVLAGVPTLVWRGHKFDVITGYDKESCTFAAGEIDSAPTTEEAVQVIENLLRDFNFASPYDKARCLAFLFTPAIARSGILDQERVPFFLVSKDKHGAGGSFLVKAVAEIYRMKPFAVAVDSKNPERIKEGISTYLAKGNGLIYVDNVRGDALKKVPFLESLLTEPLFEARAPYMQRVLDVTREIFACTSNGATLSVDLADRTAQIQILKRPDGYQFHKWSEGSLMTHISANRPIILAAIYALMCEYGLKGKGQDLRLTGFRFSSWEHCVSWLVWRFFPELPGIFEDGYLEEKQAELTNPAFDCLLNIFRHITSRCLMGELSATGLAELAVDAGVDIGGGSKPEMALGKHLTHLFPNDGIHVFAKMFKVTRVSRPTENSNGNPVKFYKVEAINATAVEDKNQRNPTPSYSSTVGISHLKLGVGSTTSVGCTPPTTFPYLLCEQALPESEADWGAAEMDQYARRLHYMIGFPEKFSHSTSP